jgi:FMN phosphatase YigB (HAD superfamily)
MKIYLDFDDTILDTGAFIRELKRVFETAGFSPAEFDEQWKKMKATTGDFDYEVFFDQFAHSGKEFDVGKARETADAVYGNMDAFVHEDFFDFAKEFRRDQLAMLSFGTTAGQRAKIENSKIVPYFSEVIVTSRGKEEDFRDIVKEQAGKRLFFVDDRAHHIDRVKEATPQVVVMKIERPSGRYVEEKAAAADHIVRDLRDVAEIIKKGQKAG